MLATHVLVGAAIALAATCGNDHDDSSAAVTTTSATTLPVTAASSAPPDASVSPSTGSPAAGATTTTTTVPVFTTEVSLTEEEAAIAEAAARAILAADVAGGDPNSVDEALLDAHYAEGGSSREYVDAFLQFLRDHGWAVRSNPDNPRRFLVESVTLGDGPPATIAEVIACVVDTTVTYEPNPGGTEAVVNDDVITARYRFEVLIEDDTWQLGDGEQLTDHVYGVTECPAAPG